MERFNSKDTKQRYRYNLGLKAILQNGQVVDIYEDTKKNLLELSHFIVQNSNYNYAELQKIDIREMLRISDMVEKDIKRRIEYSK